jgi:CDP-diacylglycerol--glycerol-3-phosphate 3-phosphatidyltransferase
MLRKTIYPKIESYLLRTAAVLDKRGITPNQLTVAGTGLSFLVALIYASGHFVLGGLALLIASAADLLDGPLARQTGKVTKFGAFLDSTLDRYCDFFIFTGLAAGFLGQDRFGLFLLSMGTLAGAFVTSYAKARAENFIPDCGVGILGRAERILLLAFGTIVTPLAPAVLWILFLGTNGTAIYRILHTHKTLPQDLNSPS